MTNATFILTLKLDRRTFERLDDLRRRHFPERLNLIPAHLTLFHRLESELGEPLREAACIPPFPVQFTSLRKLGRGVALVADAPDLLELRSKLARVFADQLTAQDRQGFRGHVTIQNKVAPTVANALYDALATDFEEFAGRGEGLLLWRYLDGPWKLEAEFPFNG